MLAHLHLAFFFVRHPAGVCCGSSCFFSSVESKKLKAKKEKPQPIILARNSIVAVRVVPHTANRPLPSGLSLAGVGLHSQRLRSFTPARKGAGLPVSCREKKKTNAVPLWPLRLFAVPRWPSCGCDADVFVCFWCFCLASLPQNRADEKTSRACGKVREAFFCLRYVTYWTQMLPIVIIVK
jgi:hypothetical protein